MIVVSNAYKERLSIGVAHSVKRRKRRAYPDGIHMENSLPLANLAIHQVLTGKPLKEIFYDVGFKQPSHFTKRFIPIRRSPKQPLGSLESFLAAFDSWIKKNETKLNLVMDSS